MDKCQGRGDETLIGAEGDDTCAWCHEKADGEHRICARCIEREMQNEAERPDGDDE